MNDTKGKNIVIFGASGRTGRLVLEQALARGYHVTAFVRDPAKLSLRHERLRVVQGDIQDAEKVAGAVAGQDAVVSALGPAQNTPDYQIERGTRHIIAAMKRHGVARLVATAGAGVRVPQDKPGLPDRLIKLALLVFSRHVYEDMRRTVALIQDSGLEWTVVRFPMLVDGNAKGSVRSGYVGGGLGVRVTRADAARFLLEQLDSEQYLRAAPMISN
jgi:putative NADH-flavin reductase